MDVDGKLSKAGGSFKIDHPLDPANKYLYHSFVESPDMMNIYNGNATLDGNGEAVIQIPNRPFLCPPSRLETQDLPNQTGILITTGGAKCRYQGGAKLSK